MKKTSFVIVLLLAGLVWSCGDDKPKEKKVDPFKTAASKEKKTTDEESSTVTVSDGDESEAAAEQTTPIPPEQIKKAKEIIAAVTDANLGAIDGKKKYKLFCTPCHGMNGKMAINGAKDLTKVKTSLEENVAQIYHGKGMMTPFKGVLKDAEIVAVANYVRNELRK
ncbi:MAG: mono/diheme cytochrome c family protein [Granulosicoccus sp.]|jgi:mono/diheme cytochrome c family protein